MQDIYELLEARQRFAAEQYEEALAELNMIPESARDAEWYAFRFEIEDKLERYYDALHSLKIATELDPKNKVYKERLKAYRKALKSAVDSSDSKEKSKCSDNCFECCGEFCCAGTCECICDGLSG